MLKERESRDFFNPFAKKTLSGGLEGQRGGSFFPLTFFGNAPLPSLAGGELRGLKGSEMATISLDSQRGGEVVFSADEEGRRIALFAISDPPVRRSGGSEGKRKGEGGRGKDCCS